MVLFDELGFGIDLIEGVVFVMVVIDYLNEKKCKFFIIIYYS